MNETESTREWEKALFALQADLRAIRPEKKGQVGNKVTSYCPLDTEWEYLRPLLQKHGFAICQIPDLHLEKLVPFLRTRVIHVESGEFVEGALLLIVAEGPGSDHQRMGSAISYARRQTINPMLGVTIGEEDDDGAMAGTTNRGTARTASDNSAWVKQQQDATRFKAEIAAAPTPEKLHAWWIEALPVVSDLTPDAVAEIKAAVAQRYNELGGEKPASKAPAPKTETKTTAPAAAAKPKVEPKAAPKSKGDDDLLNQFE